MRNTLVPNLHNQLLIANSITFPDGVKTNKLFVDHGLLKVFFDVIYILKISNCLIYHFNNSSLIIQIKPNESKLS